MIKSDDHYDDTSPKIVRCKIQLLTVLIGTRSKEHDEFF